MTHEANARTILRSATASHHQRVDDTFSSFTLSEPASYGRFLRAQAAAYLPVEDALAAGGIASLIPDWTARQRNPLLRSDLAALGLVAPPPVGRVALDGQPALLGALYVLEGSRLGGTVLRRSVAPGLPTSFLDRVDSAAWRSLLALLDVHLDTEAKLDRAAQAAGDVFALFEASGRLYSKTA